MLETGGAGPHQMLGAGLLKVTKATNPPFCHDVKEKLQ